MKKFIIFVFAFMSIISFTGCEKAASIFTGTEKAEKSITISAAASLRDPLTEIQTLYEKENNIKIYINFGGSGTLMEEIKRGAPVDLFISAATKQIDDLEKNNLIISSSKKNIASNSLVLIVSKAYKDKILKAGDLKKYPEIKIAMGEVKSVPAGIYGQEALSSLNLWKDIEDKVVYTKDVKVVITYVDNGDAAAGIVYYSDALSSKSSSLVQRFDENTHEPIVYPAAVIASSKEKEEAQQFLDFLCTQESKDIFKKYGFNIGD